MKSTDLLTAAFLKLAAETDPVADLKARARAFAGTNLPKGLPGTLRNTTNTDPDYALEKDNPKDRGWTAVRSCTGSGNGPTL